jgi:hypothetical protein
LFPVIGIEAIIMKGQSVTRETADGPARLNVQRGDIHCTRRHRTMPIAGTLPSDSNFIDD